MQDFLKNVTSKVGYSRGLVMRLNVDLSETQRMAINVYKDKKVAMKVWDEYGKKIVKDTKDAGVRVEVLEGDITVFDIGPDMDLSELDKYEF
jgi:threonyl-tRNA synthetase